MAAMRAGSNLAGGGVFTSGDSHKTIYGQFLKNRRGPKPRALLGLGDNHQVHNLRVGWAHASKLREVQGGFCDQKVKVLRKHLFFLILPLHVSIVPVTCLLLHKAQSPVIWADIQVMVGGFKALYLPADDSDQQYEQLISL